MGLLSRGSVALLFALGCGTIAHGGDWELALDLRLIDSDGKTSFLDDGLGKLRFDSAHDGLQLGRLRAAWNQPLGEVFAAHVEASAWDDDDKNPLDLTEAWLEYRPYPRAGWRSRVRLGAFYPPLSLESRAVGWETPYTITPSAIGSWIGEEIRTIGLEGQFDWLGTRQGHAFDLQFTGAVFGWNDPAGTMLADHGFALHDRQTTLFGRVGAAQSDATKPKKELFHEIDGRPGYYLGAQARYLDRAVLNVLHYDNRGDPKQQSVELRDMAWYTCFDAVGLRIETGNEWTLLVQALEGETAIDPYRLLLWAYDSQSVMLARRWGRHMLAARYDAFDLEFDHRASWAGSEDGHAWTAAWSFERDEHWRFALEWLRVESNVPARTVEFGVSPFAAETKIELQARYTLHGMGR